MTNFRSTWRRPFWSAWNCRTAPGSARTRWTSCAVWRPRPGPSVVGGLCQRRQKINPASYIGKGKLEELQQQVEAADADVVIFDNDLTPGQIRNLEKATNVKVLDRSELILDIFATRARTAEARLQVELAQLEYALPRLRKMWSHLSRIERRHRHPRPW